MIVLLVLIGCVAHNKNKTKMITKSYTGELVSKEREAPKRIFGSPRIPEQFTIGIRFKPKGARVFTIMNRWDNDKANLKEARRIFYAYKIGETVTVHWRIKQ